MSKVTCILFVFLTVVFSSVKVAIVSGDEPLHARIDKLIEAKAGGPVNTVADDSEFLRRIYLDFAGRIPTIDESQAFFADASPGKRTALIDQLLASDEFPKRMRELFHVMLMERRGDNEEWSKFLQTAFEQNKPWDQIAR
jgi:hypothetical protein